MNPIKDEILRKGLNVRPAESREAYDGTSKLIYFIEFNSKMFIFYENFKMSDIDISHKDSITDVLTFGKGTYNGIEVIVGTSQHNRAHKTKVGFYIEEGMFDLCKDGPYTKFVNDSITGNYN